MIETMKSITIAAPFSAREQMLLSLRDAGIVQIKEMKQSCEASSRISQKIHALMLNMNAISDEAGKSAAKMKQEKLGKKDFDELDERITSVCAEKKALEAERLSVSAEIGRVEPWGDFDPDEVRRLEKQGFSFSFYTLDERVLDQLREDESVQFIELKDVSRMKAIALVNSSLPHDVSAREFTLPSKSLSALRLRLGEIEKNITGCSSEIRSAAAYLDEYRLRIKELEQDAEFECARATSQEADGKICYISGFMPEESTEVFRSLCKANRWAYLIADISDDENPPTKLKYKGLIRIIQPIYDILGTVPGYREYDISSWFLLFFSIFFAMIIGDAGYGLIFLIAAIVMNVRAKKCSDTNILLYVLSATTIIYGAVTGTWFGSLSVLEKLPFLQVFIIPSICNYSMELYGIESVYAQNKVMQLCFILGAAQLALACVINVIHKAKDRDLSLFGDIGWFIDVIVLYMMALYLVIGSEVNFTIVIAGVAAGFALVVIFGSQSPSESFAKGLKAGLGGFFTSFLDTVSCFSNIMSYIRLFAVGMASLAIAQSFNNMATMAGPVFGSLIVILGTVLNIVMGLLSVVVHGVRLNLLEFSGQLGMEWTGYKYEPFRKTVQTEETKKGVTK